jgi:hypothetical protein
MAGCGGCGPEGCNGPCSTKPERSEPRKSLTESLARVIVDNRVAVRAIELYTAGITDMNEIVTQINLDKSNGTL